MRWGAARLPDWQMDRERARRVAGVDRGFAPLARRAIHPRVFGKGEIIGLSGGVLSAFGKVVK